MKIVVRFNEGKQAVKFYVAENPARFKRVNDCHAYYMPHEGRKKRSGLFGVIGLSEVTPELVAHEIIHLVADWLNTRHTALNERNEERVATMAGEIARRFWRTYERVNK